MRTRDRIVLASMHYLYKPYPPRWDMYTTATLELFILENVRPKYLNMLPAKLHDLIIRSFLTDVPRREVHYVIDRGGLFLDE